MKAEEQNNSRQGGQMHRFKRMDRQDMWLDENVPAYVLVKHDPLEISEEMVEQAENPELANFWVRRIKERPFDLRKEALERLAMKCRLRKGNSGGNCLSSGLPLVIHVGVF